MAAKRADASATPDVLPRPDFHFAGEVGRTHADSDLAAERPDNLRELQDLWWVEASRYNVLPLDWRAVIRMNAEAIGRQSLVGKRTKATSPHSWRMS